MTKALICIATLMLVFSLNACKKVDEALDPQQGTTENAGSDFKTPDWTDATHGKSAEPNYSVVFPQNTVNTLEIRMATGEWNNIKTNMKTVTGNDFGSGSTSSVGQNPPGGGGQGGVPPAGGGAAGGPLTLTTADPDYVAVSLKYNDKEWYKVGFRLKGNSSLTSAWRQGVYKLPFRLKMDEYEDKYSQIKDQRFYGFKELSMSPAYADNSLIREKVTADIFRMAGIPAAQTAFYKVYIDYGDGNGLKYCGVYTMVEVVDDTMVKTQFGEKKGNIYKPESTLASYTQSQFEKKNNEDVADYSDVQALVTALNSSTRTSNAAAWRANLEKTFNVQHFIKWLAINTAIVNWDTYGNMAHNYYLYNSPTNKLTWIPWDHNMSMSSTSASGGNQTGGAGMGRGLSLALSEVTSSWPLIRYIADDPVYYAQYKAYMKAFMADVFTVDKMQPLFEKYSNLIAPYVIGSEPEQTKYTYLTSSASFTTELNALKQHVVTRNQEVATFLK